MLRTYQKGIWSVSGKCPKAIDVNRYNYWLRVVWKSYVSTIFPLICLLSLFVDGRFFLFPVFCPTPLNLLHFYFIWFYVIEFYFRDRRYFCVLFFAWCVFFTHSRIAFPSISFTTGDFYRCNQIIFGQSIDLVFYILLTILLFQI